MSIAATYVNATTFTATYDAAGAKDLTGQCAAGTRIRADCGADGYKYGVVSSVGYSDPTTTIVMAGDSLTTNLVGFDHGNDTPFDLCNHGHTGTDDGGELPAYAQKAETPVFTAGLGVSGEESADFSFALTGSAVASNGKNYLIHADKRGAIDILVQNADETWDTVFQLERASFSVSQPAWFSGTLGLGGNVIPTADDIVVGTEARPLGDLRTASLNGVELTDDVALVSGFPNRNLFLNGDMRVAQARAGAAFSTTRTHALDGWAVTTGAGTLAGAAQSTALPTGSRARRSLELTGASGVTFVDVDQRLEALEAGSLFGTVTLSGKVYNGSASAFAPTLFLATPTSASDTFSERTVRNGSGSGEALQSCAAGAWTRVTWTADASTYSNLAYGLEARIRIPSGVLGTAGVVVRLTELKLEIGPAATPFVPRPLPEERMLCERYYQIASTSYVGVCASTTGLFIPFRFTQPMRIIPAVSALSACSVTGIYLGTFSQSSASASKESSFAASGGLVYLANFTGLTVGADYFLYSGGPIVFDAQL